jgi:SAM-dependent methyltransferase
MSLEAELPGKRVVPEEFQMIYTRYSSITTFIEDKEVLEIGCGSGLGLGYIGQYASRVVGGDLSLSNIEIAQQHYKNRIEVLVLDAHNLPFEEKSFDRIVSMETLLYLNASVFISECTKVLRKNGMILICLPNKDRLGFIPSKLSRNYFSVPEISELFQNQHFDTTIYGAFKVVKGSSDEGAWYRSKKNQIISIIGKILRSIPGGRQIKTFLGKQIFKKTELPYEIVPGMIEPSELVKLDRNVKTADYKILYVFAVKKS